MSAVDITARAAAAEEEEDVGDMLLLRAAEGGEDAEIGVLEKQTAFSVNFSSSAALHMRGSPAQTFVTPIINTR